jgi:hypothetical protein
VKYYNTTEVNITALEVEEEGWGGEIKNNIKQTIKQRN